MSKDWGETVTSRRAYECEEDRRGPGRWGSVAPNRVGSETVFPFAHAAEKSPRLTIASHLDGWSANLTLGITSRLPVIRQ